MIKPISLWLAFAMALGWGLVWTASAYAQQPTPSDDQVNAVAKGLYCPVCENVPLDVCPTQACAQWRDLIRQKLAAGWSEPQIKDYFVAQYGDRVLAEPPAKGLNWLVYILPPVVILGGAFLLYNVLRSMRRAAQVGGSAIPGRNNGAGVAGGEDDVYRRRLEEELRKREQS